MSDGNDCCNVSNSNQVDSGGSRAVSPSMNSRNSIRNGRSVSDWAHPTTSLNVGPVPAEPSPHMLQSIMHDQSFTQRPDQFNSHSSSYPVSSSASFSNYPSKEPSPLCQERQPHSNQWPQWHHARNPYNYPPRHSARHLSNPPNPAFYRGQAAYQYPPPAARRLPAPGTTRDALSRPNLPASWVAAEDLTAVVSRGTSPNYGISGFNDIKNDHKNNNIDAVQKYHKEMDSALDDKENLATQNYHSAAKKIITATATTERSVEGATPNAKKDPGVFASAVDNIIAAAEQIEKRDSPPNCPHSQNKLPCTGSSLESQNESNKPICYPPPPTYYRYPSAGNAYGASPPPPPMHPPYNSHYNQYPPNGYEDYSYPPYHRESYYNAHYFHQGPHSTPPPHHPPPSNDMRYYHPQNCSCTYCTSPSVSKHSHHIMHSDIQQLSWDDKPPLRTGPHENYSGIYDGYSDSQMGHTNKYFGSELQMVSSFTAVTDNNTTTARTPMSNKRRKTCDTGIDMKVKCSTNKAYGPSKIERYLTQEEEELEIAQVTRLTQEMEADAGLYRAILLHMALEKEYPKDRMSDREKSTNDVCDGSEGGFTEGIVGSEDFENEEGFEGFGDSPSNSSHDSLKGFGCSFPHGFMVADEPMMSTSNHVIEEGFYWKDYPMLENVLRKYMDVYYEMSENCPQSKKQQQFNNRLVSIVYHTAISNGWTFDPISFSGGNTPLTQRKLSKKNKEENPPLPPGFNYKKLRDRIRCYYKTHVQNSKKRLTTMLKNPTKPKNRDILLRVMNEIKKDSYVGPISESSLFAKSWGGLSDTQKIKSERMRLSDRVSPTVTFTSSNDSFGLKSFSADSVSPTEQKMCGSTSIMLSAADVDNCLGIDSHSQKVASPFRRMEHAAILQSMRQNQV